MKRKIIISVLIAQAAVLLPSCSSQFTGTLNLYDGSALEKTYKGKSGDKLSDATLAEIKALQGKDGYVFQGWYQTSDFSGNAVSLANYPYGEENYYARFAKAVTITLDADGGALPEKAVTTYTGVAGEAFLTTSLPTPSKENMTFSGWTYNDKPFTSTSFPESSITLKASYAPYPTLTFDTQISEYTIAPKTGKPGSAIDISDIDVSKLTKGDGYVFKGWFLDKEGTEPFSLTKMPDESTTVYAYYAGKHTISFDTGIEGYTISASLEEGTAISAPSKDNTLLKLDTDKFRKAGSYFAGWYETKDCSGEPYVFDKMPNANLTLYARWNQNPVLTLVKYVNGVETAEKKTLTDYEPGTRVDLTSSTDFASGHLIRRIYLESGESEDKTISNPESYLVPEKNVTIKVSYTEEKKATIHLLKTSDGSSYKEDTAFVYGYDGPEALTREELVKAVTPLLNEGDKISYFTSSSALASVTERKDLSYPYAIKEDADIYAVIAGKAEFNVHLETQTVKVSGYQNEELNITPVSVSSDNKYVLFGTETEINAADYNGIRFYTDDHYTQGFEFAPSYFINGLGTAVTDIYAKPVPVSK